MNIGCDEINYLDFFQCWLQHKKGGLTKYISHGCYRIQLENLSKKKEPTNLPYLLGSDHCVDLFENTTDLREKIEKETFC